MSLADGTAVAAEALVRWRHPQAGPMSATTVVGIAERTGLIGALTVWALNAVLRFAAHSRRTGRTPRFTVNLSTRALVDVELPDNRRAGAGDLERAAGADHARDHGELDDRGRRALDGHAHAPEGHGVQLAIDDFGTGYSSLAYLKRFPVDELKIDRLFVSGLLANRGDHQIVRSVIDLAHNFELRSVAEGVEEEAIRAELARMGCDLVQGYLISRPVSERDFRAWWTARGKDR